MKNLYVYQLEKEALAIIFCVKKFHKYIYERSFVLVSNHESLKILFNPDKWISVISASYYTVEYYFVCI